MENKNEGKKESTLISHSVPRGFTNVYPEFEGKLSAYCVHSPIEVLRRLARKYRIRRYKDVNMPFVANPNGGFLSGSKEKLERCARSLEIDSATPSMGCDVTASLRDLRGFLDFQGIDSYGSTSANRVLDGKKKLTQSKLRDMYAARIRFDYGPKPKLCSRVTKDDKFLARRRWVEMNGDFWKELWTEPIASEMHKSNRRLYSVLENLFLDLGHEHFPVARVGLDELTSNYNFINEDKFRELVLEGVRKEGLDDKVSPDLIHTFISSAFAQIHERMFQEGYLEILGMLHNIPNPTYIDVRKVSLERVWSAL